MKEVKSWRWLGVAGALIVPTLAVAALQIPNTFSPGDRISASEMNENFAAVKTKVDALEAQLAETPHNCTYHSNSCGPAVSCSVSCPEGQTVVGGGGACAPSNDQGTPTENRMKYNRPNSELSNWSVVCTEDTETAWAYAICCE